MKKINRCLLIIPPAHTIEKDINPAIPLGLGYIAAVLVNNKIDAKIYDCLLEGWKHHKDLIDTKGILGVPSDKIADLIRSYNPDIVTVNNQFSKNWDLAHDIYRITKEIDSNIITIAGGAHPSVMPDFVLEDKNVDFVIIGEGEITIKKLIDEIESNNPSYNNIDGLGYRTNGKPEINPKQSYIQDLDSISSPAWDIIQVERYFDISESHGSRRHARFCSIITSRGCPAKCIFCTAHCVWGKKFRARSPENVIEEIRYLKNRYDIEEILIEDDNFTFDVQRAEKICELIIDNKLNIHFDTPNGIAAYKLTPNLLLKMKQAGFERVNFAIESGDQRVLSSVICKPLNIEHVKKLIEYCKLIDLKYGLFFIIGLPGTTLQEMFQNYRFLREIRHFGLRRVHISVATPYPGSELFNICSENGLIKPNFDLKQLYIRSFIISTKDWGPFQLKILMAYGALYCYVHSIKSIIHQKDGTDDIKRPDIKELMKMMFRRILQR